MYILRQRSPNGANMCALDLRPLARAAYRHTGTKGPCNELAYGNVNAHNVNVPIGAEPIVGYPPSPRV